MSGDKFALTGLKIPAWPEFARQRWRQRIPNLPSAPVLPTDLNAMLAAQHPNTDLADPTKFELMTAALGSTDVNISLSPTIRGEAGILGLKRFFKGELDGNKIVVVFLDAKTTGTTSTPKVEGAADTESKRGQKRAAEDTTNDSQRPQQQPR